MLLRAGSVAALLGVSLLLLQVLRASTPQVPVALPPAAALPATLSPPSASPAVLVSGAPSTVGPIPDGFRVRVPRLWIDLPIAEGIIERDIERQRTPEGFAFHLPGTAIPGQRGNTYLYSHARAGTFLSLWDARIGDEIVIATPDAHAHLRRERGPPAGRADRRLRRAADGGGAADPPDLHRPRPQRPPLGGHRASSPVRRASPIAKDHLCRIRMTVIP